MAAMEFAGFRTLSIGKMAPFEASNSALTTVAPSALMAEPVPSSRTWLSAAVSTPPFLPMI